MAEANTYQNTETNPLYDISNELRDEELSAYIYDNEANDTQPAEKFPMLCILEVGRKTIKLPNEGEEDAVLIDDRREPSNDDAIDLGINSKALRFLNLFLLLTLQRIPRHYSKNCIKGSLFMVAQMIAVLLLFTASNLYELGLFGNTDTLTFNQLDNTVTSVKNILSNLKFPLLYVVGIFYFRTRHFEKLLSEVRLTQRYWKHAKRVIAIAITMMFLSSVLLPVVCKAIQMSLHTKSSRDEQYDLPSIASNCVLYIFVRLICLSVVFTFVIVVLLIYYQIRLFKAQVLKWPRCYQTFARDTFVNIKHMIKDTEKYFQPFLIIHLSIFVALLIPMIISCVEQFESEGSYTQTFLHATNMDNPYIITPPPVTTVYILPSTSANASAVNGLHQAPAGNSTQKHSEDLPKTLRSHQEKRTDYVGIYKVILGIIADFSAMLFLYSLPIILLGKIDKCIKFIKYDIGMLKFAEQKESMYMFQSQEDVNAWIAEIDGARGFQVLGMSLTSFRAFLITLLFPFVTVMLRIMLRHVDINP